MRVRTYGIIFLGLIGIAPLAIYGTLAIQRSQQTSVDKMRQGNEHMAMAVASLVKEHIDQQKNVLTTIGTAVLQARDKTLAWWSFGLDPMYDHFHNVAVYEIDPEKPTPDELALVVGDPPPDKELSYNALAQDAVKKGAVPLRVEHADSALGGGYFLTMVEPIRIAGTLRGAIVGRYDLVGLWVTIGSVQIRDTGFIRLISGEGETIAHGHPDERRAAFMSKEENRPLLNAALANELTRNISGQEIMVSTVPLSNLSWDNPDYHWYVLVEQSVDEAFAEIDAMKRTLVIAGMGVLGAVVIMGLFIGRNLVRALEHLRAHTRILPGNLEQRLTSQSALREIKDLSDAIDRMAGDLTRERDDARKRERLTTFARVAAGLAHDLRLPVEVVHDACETVNHNPNDENAHAFLRKVSERELPRLKRFVDDLQRIARKGELALETNLISPRALVESVCAELTGTRKWRGVHFTTGGQGAALALDEGLVRRAVLNLAGNAADACLAKGPGNQVALEVADSNENWVEFRVIDTGTGISAERLAMLEQGDFYSSKRSNGVGLGLGVVRQVAESHRGEVLMESEVGVGSKFILRLPRSFAPQ